MCCGNDLELATILGTSITGAQGPIGPAGPTGAAGPTGPAGVQGPAGPSSIIVRATINTAPDASAYLTGQIMYVEDIDAFYQVTNGSWVLFGSKEPQEELFSALTSHLFRYTSGGTVLAGTFVPGGKIRYKFVNGAVLVNVNLSWDDMSATTMRYMRIKLNTIPGIAAYLAAGFTLNTNVVSEQVIYARSNGALTFTLSVSLKYDVAFGYFFEITRVGSDWGASTGDSIEVNFSETLYIKPKVTL